MKRTLSSIPALMACCILSLCSGCAGMAGLNAKSDHHGGVVVYETEGAYPRAVARVDSEGNRFVLPPKSGEIERGAGGVDAVSESLDANVNANYSGPSDGEFWLAFTVVYLIVLLIEVIISAIDEAN